MELGPRPGTRPTTSSEGPHRQLDQQATPELWGRLVAEVFALPHTVEGRSQVSPSSSRAVLLDDLREVLDPTTSLAPGPPLEPVHLHGVDDTSSHLCLPADRARQVYELGWGEPHGYADHATEVMVYGPRDTGELHVVLALVRESLDHARGATSDTRVRDATGHDAEACAAIYAPYVTDTAITFETEPPTAAEMARRIAAAQHRHAWLVLQDRGQVVGYAYGSLHKERPAYRWSCEVSVYLERGRTRTGGGRRLYDALFLRLADRGFRTVVAGMALPNDASVGLHDAMGFRRIGTWRAIGFKGGAWHDVAWAQKAIGAGTDPPAELDWPSGQGPRQA